jgi:hypothetical protein
MQNSAPQRLHNVSKVLRLYEREIGGDLPGHVVAAFL